MNSRIAWAISACVIVALGLWALVAAVTRMTAEERPVTEAGADDKSWQAVAPGLVEPISGEIKIAAPLVGRIVEVLTAANDQVFAGQLLIRLADDEARARVDSAAAQVALRTRTRNDKSARGRAADRRKAEDSEFDAEKAIIAARSAFDNATVAKRNGRGSDRNVELARSSLTRAQDRLQQQKTDHRRLEADSDVPLPTEAEGELNMARADFLAAAAAVEKLMIRAPIAATVLAVNAKTGELASPSAPQPLVVLGDLSGMRVRAELDERDFGEVKVGQSAVVRTADLRGREFAGKVASIAPIVEQGRILRGQRNLVDLNVVEVLVDLMEPNGLAVGMKVDVYFRHDVSATQ
ncbi:MAG TPA: efflux RND transporter periplasmic adaptor subunit [Xanthobacteraceae bacterium]